jgi:hypothetical protein
MTAQPTYVIKAEGVAKLYQAGNVRLPIPRDVNLFVRRGARLSIVDLLRLV